MEKENGLQEAFLEIDSQKSIPGLLKRLQIRAQVITLFSPERNQETYAWQAV